MNTKQYQIYVLAVVFCLLMLFFLSYRVVVTTPPILPPEPSPIPTSGCDLPTSINRSVVLKDVEIVAVRPELFSHNYPVVCEKNVP